MQLLLVGENFNLVKRDTGSTYFAMSQTSIIALTASRASIVVGRTVQPRVNVFDINVVSFHSGMTGIDAGKGIRSFYFTYEYRHAAFPYRFLKRFIVFLLYAFPALYQSKSNLIHFFSACLLALRGARQF
jgi:hypothetical protein